jgi:hypothetical protein
MDGGQLVTRVYDYSYGMEDYDFRQFSTSGNITWLGQWQRRVSVLCRPVEIRGPGGVSVVLWEYAGDGSLFTF